MKKFAIQANTGAYVTQQGTTPALTTAPALAYVWDDEEFANALLPAYLGYLKGRQGVADLQVVFHPAHSPTEKLVAEELTRRGIKASYEYPGFVNIPVSQTTQWSFGTINENWSGDIATADGTHIDCATLDLPSTWQVVEDIAAAIIAELKKRGYV
jgi:hypothetical protein